MAIKLGAGGGGSNVNDVRFINNSANLITTESGEVWLKGGVTETDLTTYPDATAGLAYAGTTFSTAAQATSVDGESDIGWDGTYFWLLERGNARVYKYNASGVYQGSNFSVYAQDPQPMGIVCVGSDFYISGETNHKISKYNSSGVFQSDWSVPAPRHFVRAIAYDGTYLWLLSNYLQTVNKYSLAGVYQNVSFSVSNAGSNLHGLAWDGTHFWLAERTTDKLFQYTAAGVSTGFTFSLASQGTSPYGVTWDGSALWTVDNSSSAAFKYQNQIGVANVAPTISGGKQNYIRIK
jgi:hypothetical protein